MKVLWPGVRELLRYPRTDEPGGFPSGNIPENKGIRKTAAAHARGAVHASRRFSGSVEPRNHQAVGAEHLCAGRDRNPAAGIGNS